MCAWGPHLAFPLGICGSLGVSVHPMQMCYLGSSIPVSACLKARALRCNSTAIMYYIPLYMFAPVRTCVGVRIPGYLCVSVSLQESQEINTLTSRSRRNVGFLCSSAPSLPLLQSQKRN